MLKKINILSVVLSFVLIACGSAEEAEECGGIDSTSVEEVEEEEDNSDKRKSPRTQKEGNTTDGVAISIDYGSPYVKGRTIWGDLIPYDKVWRAGADEATAITFGSDILFGGKEVAAGTYAFFIIPRQDSEWTVILNEEWSREIHGVWGAYDYKEEKDVCRFNVAVDWRQEMVESLAYGVKSQAVFFEWENAYIEIPVQAK